MIILHVTETAKGGVGTYIDMIAASQISLRGEESLIIIAPRQHIDQFSAVNRKTITVFNRPKRSILSLFRFALVIAKTVQRHKPDIIHAHSSFAGALVRLMYGRRKRGPLVVYCPHAWPFQVFSPGPRRFAVEFFERMASGLCSLIIAVSEHERESGLAVGIPDQKIKTVLNAMPDLDFSPPKMPEERKAQNAPLKILFIGRLDRQKGFDLLLDATSNLGALVSIRAAGASVVESTAANQFRRSNIEYLGWLTPDQIEAELSDTDILALPSRWEGLPLVALEAMRAGVPILAFAVGGIPEAVVDNVTGRLVAAENVDAFRAAILDTDKDTWRVLGNQGRARFVELFTSERLINELELLYDEIIKNATI